MLRHLCIAVSPLSLLHELETEEKKARVKTEKMMREKRKEENRNGDEREEVADAASPSQFTASPRSHRLSPRLSLQAQTFIASGVLCSAP
ncbi:hypothetical protein M0R45_009101 [Rubus argutus]|uniref:Uncharacterized protein n=1 Tax=Rubus argutus TaxID=59490 RepID=A0AAW1Y3J4_RUBAR